MKYKNNQTNTNNRFPIEAFPEPIQEVIKQTNQKLSFPIDFIGSSILYATSVAIGNTYKAEIKRGFQENAVIYLAIVAKPGTNKSHPLSFAIDPIIERDKASHSLYEQQKKEYDEGTNKGGKQSKDSDIPFCKKILVSDFTPEALSEVHNQNKRGIGVYIDELAGWFKNFNRYTNGSEMEFWLSIWNSKPINIDRKSGDPIFIKSPFIPVGGTIQNGLLKTLAKDNRSENGFIDRILFVFPDNIEKSYWSEDEIQQQVINDYNKIINNILDIEMEYDETSNPIPKVLIFTRKAKETLFEWQKDNADQCNDLESDAIKGMYSKLDMYAARFALILEILNGSCIKCSSTEITKKSVDGAIKLVEYFKRSAVKVHSIISDISPTEFLPGDKYELYHQLPEFFSTGEGVVIAKQMGIPERTFKRLIDNRDLFNYISRGKYQKYWVD